LPRRHPQPFWREFTRCWYVQIGKKQVRLSPDRDEAFRIYYELMSRGREGQPSPSATTLAPTPTRAVEVLDAFLDWCGRNKAARTYEHYRANIQRFVSRIPAALTVTELKPFHVTRAMADFPDWGNNTKHDFIAALKRALNWAVDEELIARNPLARMKKPAREAREMAVSPEEYARVLETVVEPCFRDLIEIAWETGSRVQELRRFEARFVDFASGRIVLPPSKAKGKRQHRVIYLTDRAREVLARLCREAPSGPLLRNSEGNAWTKDAINCAFCRLQLALGRQALRELGIKETVPRRFPKEGIAPERLEEARATHRDARRQSLKDAERLAREHGTKYHLGAFRKGYATEALKNGVDTVTVAHLLGHADASMVSRVYAKVQQDPRFMAEAARRAKGLKADASSSGTNP
jgi:integrase